LREREPDLSIPIFSTALQKRLIHRFIASKSR